MKLCDFVPQHRLPPKLIIGLPALWSPQTVWRAGQPGFQASISTHASTLSIYTKCWGNSVIFYVGYQKKKKKPFGSTNSQTWVSISLSWGTCSNRLWWSIPSISAPVSVQWGQRMYNILQRSPSDISDAHGERTSFEKSLLISSQSFLPRWGETYFSSFASSLLSSYKCTSIPDVPFELLCHYLGYLF